MAYVVARVEVRVVDPDGTALAERDVRELLAIARHEVHPRLDRLDQLVVGGRVAVEDEDRRDVHVCAAALEVQESRVERCQAIVVGHGPILTRRPAIDKLA